MQPGSGRKSPIYRAPSLLDLQWPGDLVCRQILERTDRLGADDGEATDYDPRSGDTTKVSRPRDPNVEGPGGYFFAVPDAPGTLTFVAPATGTYRFSFSPCAMWGAPGAVRICTR